MSLLEGMPEKSFRSSVVKASCAFVSARLVLSQTLLDEWELAFSFPLSATRYFFGRGVISSIEVAREEVLVTSGRRQQE